MSARELDVLFQNKASARNFSSEAAASLSAATPVTDAKLETSSTEAVKSVVSKSSTDGRVQAKQVENVSLAGSSSP